MTGRGNNHPVSTIFPPDNVEVENKYVFPSILQSENHVSCWLAVSKLWLMTDSKLVDMKTLRLPTAILI